MLEIRKCKTCGTEKSLLENFRRKISKSGPSFERQCLDCNVEATKRWRQSNLIETRAKQRFYRIANESEINRKRREYRLLHHEKVYETEKQWRIKNVEIVRARARISAKRFRARYPEKVRAIVRYQRAKRGGARVEYVNEDQIQDLYTKQRGCCAACKKKLDRWHIDHKQPLAKGGAHEFLNLQLLCPLCNRRKYSSHPIDFMRKLGFLL